MPSNENNPPQPPQVKRTSTTLSASKVHDAIQDIIAQFDPLKVASAQDKDSKQEEDTTGKQIDEQELLRAKFEPDKDGFNYNNFLQQLRQPSAKPIARTVKSFLTEFSRRPMTLSEQVRFVHEFLDFIATKMREVWQEMDDAELENAREGMEKLVMNRLYPVCFAPATSDDADRDHVVREKMSLFRWVTEVHLDIPESPQNRAYMQYAKTELLKINNFKSPRDKVICILNCCTVIYGLLNNTEDEVGADKFLPVLIYVVIKACPARLVSNIQYILRFRSQERMQGEAGYYVTHLQGAVAFIESMDASCLSIGQEEFDKNIEMTIWELEMEKTKQKKSSSMEPSAEERGDAQWFMDRSSDLARSTLEKTNNFVGRLLSELSTPSEEPPMSSSYPGNAPSSEPAGDKVTVATIIDMFPNIDEDVVEIVYESNGGVASQVIEQLLDMSMGQEALEVVRAEEDGLENVDGAAAAAEMEEWKDNRWER